MTDLETIGFANVRPQIGRLSWVDVDIHLSRNLDPFDVEAAHRRGLELDLEEGSGSITISVPVESFKDNVVELDQWLGEISVDAANLRKLHQSAIDRVNEQAKSITFGRDATS
ncbi:hypothetical protein [Aeromicrobium sp. Root472D3]|uniref:hypothetical protein n=1 Tax=Aeromicrobium sp. Root472D3 TaxID=1736540 RepID=UPI0006FD685A|nr:hypothetical protein [Aeromicrobium sp. Root472D3]KQX76048.1 hypothetical protein ASD10_13210 [Aeromicrobium sp. Root472D3]